MWPATELYSQCRPRDIATLLFLLLTVTQTALAEIASEGPRTVFRTGTNEVLSTLSLLFNPAPTNTPAVLRFDFGFATSEPDLPDTFFDSFSATLQGSDSSNTALLFTADRTGVQWAPDNPGGLTLNSGDLQHAAQSFPDLSPGLALKFAYSLTFLLPAPLLTGPLTLFFDLFNNLNAAMSLAFVQDLRIESAVRGVRLSSAAAIDGPFTEETGAAWDEANRTFSLGKPGGNRFFRIFSGRPTRIVQLRPTGSQLLIDYQFVQTKLFSAATVTGPYTQEAGALLNEINRSFTLNKPGGNARFYKIHSDAKARISRLNLQGNQVIVDYEFQP